MENKKKQYLNLSEFEYYNRFSNKAELTTSSSVKSYSNSKSKKSEKIKEINKATSINEFDLYNITCDVNVKYFKLNLINIKS